MSKGLDGLLSTSPMTHPQPTVLSQFHSHSIFQWNKGFIDLIRTSIPSWQRVWHGNSRIRCSAKNFLGSIERNYTYNWYNWDLSLKNFHSNNARMEKLLTAECRLSQISFRFHCRITQHFRRFLKENRDYFLRMGVPQSLGCRKREQISWTLVAS